MCIIIYFNLVTLRYGRRRSTSNSKRPKNIGNVRKRRPDCRTWGSCKVKPSKTNPASGFRRDNHTKKEENVKHNKKRKKKKTKATVVKPDEIKTDSKGLRQNGSTTARNGMTKKSNRSLRSNKKGDSSKHNGKKGHKIKKTKKMKNFSTGDYVENNVRRRNRNNAGRKLFVTLIMNISVQ